MSSVKSRLSGLLGHFNGAPSPTFEHRINNHTLSPTFFLPRAAAIEPNVSLPLTGWNLSASDEDYTGRGHLPCNRQQQDPASDLW